MAAASTEAARNAAVELATDGGSGAYRCLTQLLDDYRRAQRRDGTPTAALLFDDPPPGTGDVRVDAALAGLAEHLARHDGWAARHDLPDDWLNDGVKGFLPGDDPRARPVHESAALRVDVASPQYLLAMKLLAAREEDVEDIVVRYPAPSVTRSFTFALRAVAPDIRCGPE